MLPNDHLPSLVVARPARDQVGLANAPRSTQSRFGLNLLKCGTDSRHSDLDHARIGGSHPFMAPAVRPSMKFAPASVTSALEPGVPIVGLREFKMGGGGAAAYTG